MLRPSEDPERAELPEPSLIPPDAILDSEWLEWMALTPAERLSESGKLWQHYLSIGGSLDPDPDPQSPFWSRDEIEEFARRSSPSRLTRGKM